VDGRVREGRIRVFRASQGSKRWARMAAREEVVRVWRVAIGGRVY